jgi:tRNA(Ile)-lysidine synthase
MFQVREKVVVGVSGGCDSTALLHLLLELEELRLSLVVAHLNHGLRGAESDGDEEFVATLARDLGLPFEVTRCDVASLARQGSISLEEAGREERYAFFRQVAEAHGARCIAVAHTLDDQAETVLLRIARGTGPFGLRGMEAVTAGGVVRPLLGCHKEELRTYLLARGIPWREDESNENPVFQRNLVRHELLPSLARLNPRIADALLNLSRLSGEDEAFLEGMAEEEYLRLAMTSAAGVTLPVAGLLRRPRPLRFRLLRLALRQVKGDLRRLTLQHVEEMDRLLTSSPPNASCDLPGGIRVVRAYDRLTVEPRGWAAEPWQSPVPIPGEGSHQLPDGSLLVVEQCRGPGGAPADSEAAIWIDGSLCPFPWEVRSFRPGDRLSLPGLVGRKKVKKLFGEWRLSVCERSRVPILLCKGQVLWICGMRRSDVGRPAASVGALLRVSWKNRRGGLHSA